MQQKSEKRTLPRKELTEHDRQVSKLKKIPRKEKVNNFHEPRCIGNLMRPPPPRPNMGKFEIWKILNFGSPPPKKKG